MHAALAGHFAAGDAGQEFMHGGAAPRVRAEHRRRAASPDPAALRFLRPATRPSITAEFRATDGGRTAVYMVRWATTRGEIWPWSEVCAATVAA